MHQEPSDEGVHRTIKVTWLTITAEGRKALADT
jgi:hypothetical protein